MPPVIWYSFRLIRIIEETLNTRRFILKLDSDDVFRYQAGQFLTCDLPIGEKRAQRWRSYSIANSYPDQGEIEFCISYKEKGLASEYFFNTIKIGDHIKAKGPEGNFILPEAGELNVYMICTGTGLAPFRAMIQQIIHQKLNYKSLHLVYGTRKKEDIIYLADLTSWADMVPGLEVHICLSRASEIEESPSHKLHVHKGYVHPIYQNSFLQKNLDPAHTVFMICGWSAMIDEAVLHLFKELKIPRECIRFELYG